MEGGRRRRRSGRGFKRADRCPRWPGALQPGRPRAYRTRDQGSGRWIASQRRRTWKQHWRAEEDKRSSNRQTPGAAFFALVQPTCRVNEEPRSSKTEDFLGAGEHPKKPDSPPEGRFPIPSGTQGGGPGVHKRPPFTTGLLRPTLKRNRRKPHVQVVAWRTRGIRSRFLGRRTRSLVR